MDNGCHLATQLAGLGFDAAVGVPDSHLTPLVDAMAATMPVTLAVREDAAVAYACGLSIGGRRPLLFMKNAGLFAAGDALVSLAADLRVALFLVVGWAGSGGDRLAHHVVTGERTIGFLNAMGIAAHQHSSVADSTSQEAAIRAGYARVQDGRGHFALLVMPG
jgi:sulfopyruvate decarboxylase TPP-binding subunit